MKKWEIAFVDEHGDLLKLLVESEQRPSDEEAAKHVRSHYRPVLDKADLNDFENRTEQPTAKVLKDMNAMEVRSVTPVD
ncbi:MAG: hypothetical protein PW845_02085 [Pseudomonas sp.]|uniref:hypothetical protein n=1 Tax=Pseudomonas abieticivorans TaxID=2931382 RepID=UPI0020BE1695|nr:hypothetical protein [Pseudomonas sp. PIA16]MDE1164182.1 hypothetical protein [Pseudomonas sp.]